jgi:hypothetical protein
MCASRAPALDGGDVADALRGAKINRPQLVYFSSGVLV